MVAHTLANQGASGPARVTVSAVDTMSGLDGAPACAVDGADLELVAGLDGAAACTVDGTHQVRCTATNYVGTTATATDTIAITH